MQTNDFSNLPTSWQIKTLGEVLNYEQPTKYIVKSTKYNDSYKTPVLTAGKSFILGYTDELESIFTQIPVIIFDDFTTDTKFVDFKFKVKSSAMKILHSKENADIKFIYYFMQTIRHRSDTHKRYWISEYAKIKIPLPPLEIQKRIVARLESAFEKIEKGSAHLQDAKTKLAKYKQSLLKSAFNGTLFCHTEGEARSIPNQESRDISLTLNMTNSPSLRANEASVAIQNNDTTKAIDCHSPNGLCNDSTHSSLRGSAADEAIHKVDCHESANADSRNDNESVDCHDLTSSKLAMTDKENPKLPQGWTIKTLGEVFKVVGGGTPSTAKTEFWNGNIAWITSADIDLQGFIITPKRFITNEAIQSSTTNCVEKDTIIVVTRVGLGKVGITDRQTCFSQDSQALIPLENVNVKFMAFQIKNQAKNFISVSRGTTINGITKNTLKELKLVVPPLETQKQIVKLLERYFECADKTGEFIESAINKAKQLKQSLLKSAFLGKLT